MYVYTTLHVSSVNACLLACMGPYMYLIYRPPKKKKEETNTDDPAGSDPPSPKRPKPPDDVLSQISSNHPPSPKRSKPDNVLPQTPIGWTSPRKPGSTTSTPVKDSSQDTE